MSRLPALVLAALAAGSAGCGSGSPPSPVAGDAKQGRERILFYGCGACHVIGGISIANGHVGPSLKSLDRRRTIAGKLPNTTVNLIRWIRHPQRIDPGAIMPELGLSRGDAEDIVAYLHRQ